MKKILGLCFSLCLLSFVAISQESITEATNTATEQAYDVDTNAKKAACKKVCTAKGTASTGNVKSALVSMDGETSSADKKCDIKACAKKMGISEAECRKICDKTVAKEGKTDGETQVASSIMENTDKLVEAGTAKKACSKTCKKASNK